MLYSYPECIEKFGSDYRLQKEIEEGRLFRQEKGIYSDIQYVPEIEILLKKYPNTVLTFYSAFYYHGLTDTIPEHYYMATARGRRKITDGRIKQIFDNSGKLELGKIYMEYDGVSVPIYDRERMLVELMRNKGKIPFDLYKELVVSYRRIINELDLALVSDYAYELPKTDMVMETLRLEVL